MAQQDVAEFAARVRRAIEGPVSDATAVLTLEQCTVMAADAIGDIILMSGLEWPHSLIVTERAASTDAGITYPTDWAVDPPLEEYEVSVVASQAALSYIFVTIKDMKVSEDMTNEGQSWAWTRSAQVLRDWVSSLKDQRDAALAALNQINPVWVRVGSFLQVRDVYGSALIEWWSRGGNPTVGVLSDPGLGLGGGMELDPSTWRPGP